MKRARIAELRKCAPVHKSTWGEPLEELEAAHEHLDRAGVPDNGFTVRDRITLTLLQFGESRRAESDIRTQLETVKRQLREALAKAERVVAESEQRRVEEDAARAAAFGKEAYAALDHGQKRFK